MGLIHLFNRNWDVTSFKGHDGCISFCELAAQHNLLITVGVTKINLSIKCDVIYSICIDVL